MKTKPVALILLPLALTLAACGDTWGERAVTGGGIGAGIGLAIGALKLSLTDVSCGAATTDKK